MGHNGLAEEFEHVASLLAAGSRHRQDTLDEASAGLAVGAKTRLSPEDCGTNRSLGRVVRRLDAIDSDKGPQRRSELEDLLTRRRGLGMSGVGSELERLEDHGAHGLHLAPQRSSIDLAGTEQLPEREHLGRPVEQCIADVGALPAALCNPAKIADQMRPTRLTARHREPTVGRVAVRDQDATELIAEKLS